MIVEIYGNVACDIRPDGSPWVSLSDYKAIYTKLAALQAALLLIEAETTKMPDDLTAAMKRINTWCNEVLAPEKAE